MGSILEAFALAQQHHHAGSLHEAERIYRLILEKEPEHPDALRLLGVIALQVGKYAEAVDLLRKVVALRPDMSEAYSDLGLALQGQGKLAEAHLAYRKAVTLNPDYAEGHNNLGLAMQAQGKLDNATVAYKKALSLKPTFPLALNNLARVLQMQGNLDEAVALYRQAISQAPNYIEAHHNLGIALQAQAKFDEARTAYEHAIALGPQDPAAHNNLGVVLQNQGRLGEAVTAFREALRLKADYAEACNNLGLALQALGNLGEARVWFDRAVELKADYVEAIVNRAQCLLLSGDLPRGFVEYECRWKRPGSPPRLFTPPSWDGSPLKGRRILLYAEHGLGDTIQFVRYVPLVAQHGGRIIVECDPTLARLLRTVSGIERVIPRGEPLPEFEVHCPLLSLPRIFGTTLDTIPAQVPYLSAPASSFTLESPGKSWLKIGIVWAGRPEHGNDRNRSCAITHFLQFRKYPQVFFYSLQKGPQGQAVEQLTGQLKVQNLSDRLTDFAKTASVISQLDLIITVDTAMAHLAGAVGKPVWTILPYAPDWRWLLGREESPWYPTMRLFRQPKPGDWESVFARLAQEVKRMC